MSNQILTDEQIYELSREDLQNELRARELSSGGSTAVLRDRLKDWMLEQEPSSFADTDADTEAEAAADIDADTEADVEADAEADADLSPPAPEVAADDVATDEVDTGAAGGRVVLYTSNPEPEPTEDVPLLEGDQPAESYRALCETQTVVRVRDTHIVQVLDIPFSPRAKQLAYQQLGIRFRNFVNEELTEPTATEEPPTE